MVKQANIFRIFISSTFRDFKYERDALQESVFPKLDHFCAERGARFQAIDLRCGISEEASLSQRAVSICLNEIARCQRTTQSPNFMLLLGDRYGWQPLPENIPASEFDSLIKYVGTNTFNLLHQWYFLDENAVPAVYLLFTCCNRAIRHMTSGDCGSLLNRNFGMLYKMPLSRQILRMSNMLNMKLRLPSRKY